jgi:hypothetical protein
VVTAPTYGSAGVIPCFFNTSAADNGEKYANVGLATSVLIHAK